MAARSPLLLRHWPREGIWGDIPSSCPNHSFWEPSLFLPCSALVANKRFSLVQRKDPSGRADELQDRVSPPVRTLQTSLLSMRCYLGILPVGSDVCLMLRTICVGKCLFGTPYPSSSQCICDSSVFWCVSVYSICVIGILVAFCKTVNSGSIH